MNKQAQSEFVHPLALGEGEGFTHEAAQALAQRAVPAFHMAGFTRALATKAMRALWEHLIVGEPEVATCGTAAVRGWDACTQGAGAVGRTVAHEVRDDLAGLAAESDPHPAGVGFRANEAPEFIEFEHVALLGGQKRLTQRWEGFGFFSSQPVMVLRPTPKTRAAARRLKRSLATARNTSAWRSGVASRLLGCNTRHAAHVRQRNCWRPQALWPFLTMRSLPQRVQRGAACAAKEDVFAITQHRR